MNGKASHQLTDCNRQRERVMKSYPRRLTSYAPQSLRSKIILLACGVSLVTSLALGVLLVLRTTSLSHDMAVENVAHETQLVALEFKRAYDEMINDAFVVSRTPPIQGMLRSAANNQIDPLDRSTTDQWRQRLEDIFVSMMRERTTYTQMRYIGLDNKGRELVRVNRSSNGWERVAESRLQAKSEEDYFQKALTLSRGEAYFSNVTYNREFGTLDSDLVPTLRAIVPIFDSKGKIFGMVVINADYSAMLRERFDVIQLKRNIIVSNEAGDYMEQHADGSVAAFQYNTEGSSDRAQLLAALRPKREDHDSAWLQNTENDLIYSARLPISQRLDDSHLIISIRVPHSELMTGVMRIRNEGALLALLLIGVSLGGAAWASTRLTAPLLAMTTSIRQARLSGGVPALAIERADEIGELAGAFQGLAQDLKGAEARVRAIFDNVLDGIFSTDEQGMIQDFSPSSERIFGASHEDITGRNIGLLMPESILTDYEPFLSSDQKPSPGIVVGVTRESEGRRLDGSTFPMEISLSKVDAGGQVMFIGIVRDITERKQMETLKSEFVSTVNHELRTPLTSIQASLGILQKLLRGKVGPKEERLLDISLLSTERLGRLVNDILDVEKIAAGKMEFYPEVCDMKGLVTDIVERHQSLAEKYGVTFQLKADIPVTYSLVDPSRFNQALVNLLSNAAKFSPDGEAVMIEIMEQANDRIQISVSDKGPGIPASFRDKIFQRFAQADGSATRMAGGSGLGLNITKSIVESLGGEITYDSVEGHGATFRLNFPTCTPSTK
jgi:PAS domain S-box-containing protein